MHSYSEITDANCSLEEGAQTNFSGILSSETFLQ